MFAYIPKQGYVGVGVVKQNVVPVTEFIVDVKGQKTPITDAPTKAHDIGHHADNPELSEYFVRVEWIKTRSKEDAILETGMFASQHTVCRLRNKFTLEKLTQAFGLED